jgi:hypothetical protein
MRFGGGHDGFTLRAPTTFKILFFRQFSGVFYKRIISLFLRERDGDESVVR